MHCYLLECCQMTSAIVLLVYTNLRKCLLPSNQHFTQSFENDLHIFSQPIIYSYFVAVVVVPNVQLLWEYFTKKFQNLCLEPAWTLAMGHNSKQDGLTGKVWQNWSSNNLILFPKWEKISPILSKTGTNPNPLIFHFTYQSYPPLFFFFLKVRLAGMIE